MQCLVYIDDDDDGMEVNGRLTVIDPDKVLYDLYMAHWQLSHR